MKKIIFSGVLTLLFVGAIAIPSVHAETTTSLSQLQALMTQLESLQKQLAALKGEIQTVLKDGLVEGTSDDDIKEIQEILATDPSLYPQGLVTGYFGPMTKEAIKKFQLRHELEVTGVIDAETRALFENYLEEKHDGKVPEGLLRAPGIAKKIELRYKEECDNSGEGRNPLCKKLKIKYKNENGEEELEIESEDEEDEDIGEDDDN